LSNKPQTPDTKLSFVLTRGLSEQKSSLFAYIQCSVHRIHLTKMAPQAKVQCFAAKDKKGRLERCEYEPLPLQAGDIGTMDLHIVGWISACTLCYANRVQPFSESSHDLFLASTEIRVTHNGLCHSDVHVMREEWGPCKYPMVPGHEVYCPSEVLNMPLICTQIVTSRSTLMCTHVLIALPGSSNEISRVCKA